MCIDFDSDSDTDIDSESGKFEMMCPWDLTWHAAERFGQFKYVGCGGEVCGSKMNVTNQFDRFWVSSMVIRDVLACEQFLRLLSIHKRQHLQPLEVPNVSTLKRRTRNRGMDSA